MTANRRRLVFGLAAILLAALAFFLAQRRAMLLPVWIRWEKTRIDCRDPAEPDCICLRAGRITVQKDGKAVWQTERTTPVQSVLWGDIDRDGSRELMLLCWKRGRYGAHRPFWVQEDEKSWSQHIYLYDWSEGTMRPIWMASDIGLEAVGWSFDEQNRLVITDRTGALTAWDWLDWGLTLISLTDSEGRVFAEFAEKTMGFGYGSPHWQEPSGGRFTVYSSQ